MSTIAAISGPAGISVVPITRYLESVGKTVSDVAFEKVDLADMPAALDAGAVDAAWVNAPVTTMLEETGRYQRVVGYENGEYGAGYLMGPNLLRDHPEVGQPSSAPWPAPRATTSAATTRRTRQRGARDRSRVHAGVTSSARRRFTFDAALPTDAIQKAQAWIAVGDILKADTPLEPTAYLDGPFLDRALGTTTVPSRRLVRRCSTGCAAGRRLPLTASRSATALTTSMPPVSPATGRVDGGERACGDGRRMRRRTCLSSSIVLSDRPSPCSRARSAASGSSRWDAAAPWFSSDGWSSARAARRATSPGRASTSARLRINGRGRLDAAGGRHCPPATTGLPARGRAVLVGVDRAPWRRPVVVGDGPALATRDARADEMDAGDRRQPLIMPLDSSWA
ncbi:MAG: hypothetical protein U0R65_02510 [Candidatus Nanopelagicales bacterium]